MKHRQSLKYLLLSLPPILLAVLALQAGGGIKEPNVAGAFYPADRTTLGRSVNEYVARANTAAVPGRLIALIAPHAGYQYSGQVAAYAYKQLQNRPVRTVILVGASHHYSYSGAAVLTEGGMRTPLGTVRIDANAAKTVLDEKAQVRAYPAAFEKEHSLEVQLPFLQSLAGDVAVVPILIGQPTQGSFDSLTRSITSVLAKDPDAIIIASTDLSHYHDDAAARKLDAKAIHAVERLSIEELERSLADGTCEMCGGHPVLLTMAVSRRLGATHGVLYRYANSGDVNGDRSRVVGYAAMGLYQGGLSDAERRELLQLAKRTITDFVQQGKSPAYQTTSPRMLANSATFVTINRKGMLRGCIGNLQPVMPLYRSVMANAVSACSRDPRFPPLSAAELKDMEVEVTVLSPLEPLQDVAAIRIGTHGLFIVQGMNTGVLLPQVAEEYRWDVPTFLEQVSLKAGLRKDAWKTSQLYTFTADIIR